MGCLYTNNVCESVRLTEALVSAKQDGFNVIIFTRFVK